MVYYIMTENGWHLAETAALEREETRIWHLSAHALFELYQEELQTGHITYPEEA